MCCKAQTAPIMKLTESGGICSIHFWTTWFPCLSFCTSAMIQIQSANRKRQQGSPKQAQPDQVKKHVGDTFCNIALQRWRQHDLQVFGDSTNRLNKCGIYSESRPNGISGNNGPNGTWPKTGLPNSLPKEAFCAIWLVVNIYIYIYIYIICIIYNLENIYNIWFKKKHICFCLCAIWMEIKFEHPSHVSTASQIASVTPAFVFACVPFEW